MEKENEIKDNKKTNRAKIKEWLHLFLIFFKISMLCPGGGATMMPLLINDMHEKRGWFTPDELAECFGLAQSLPGPIAANVATYLGKKKAGLPGAIVAVVGALIPAVVMIILVVWLLSLFDLREILTYALAGIKSASIALICISAITMIKRGINTKWDTVLFVVLILIVLFFDIDAYLIVIIAALCGCIAFAVERARGKDDD